MYTLGIETSSAAGSVALVRDGTLLDERPLEAAGHRHARSLVGEIDRLLRHFGVKPAACDVAVSIGPGSFTGLRVGVVAAKTFAWATGGRLAAVETFRAIAENSPPDVQDVWITANAQRGELYVGRFQRAADGQRLSEKGDRHPPSSGHSQLQTPDPGASPPFRTASQFIRTGELAIQAIEAFCAARAGGDAVGGPGADLIESRVPEHVRVLARGFRQARAAVVAELGERALLAGETADPWALAPLYLRKSAAEEKWDSRAT